MWASSTGADLSWNRSARQVQFALDVDDRDLWLAARKDLQLRELAALVESIFDEGRGSGFCKNSTSATPMPT